MVNNNTITLSSPDSEFRLPLNVSLVPPKKEMLLPASKSKVAVSMILNEDKTEIIEFEEIVYDDFDEEREIPIIKQEKNCTITNLTCKPPNDRPKLNWEFGITQEVVVNIVRADLEKLSKDTRCRRRSAKLQNAALSKQVAIKSEASNDVETDIDTDNAENSDWVIKNEEVHIKFEEGEEDDHQESSSTGSSRRDQEDDKCQRQQSKRRTARPSRKGRKRIRHCPHCFYEASCASYLERHISIVHGNGEGIEKYSCSKCTFQTFYKSKLTQHIGRHDGVQVKSQRCSRCGYSTSRKKGLTDHVCNKDLEVLTCYDCGYQTRIKSLLRAHVLCHSHTKHFAFNCDVCSFRAKYQRHLKSHMLRHNTNLEDLRKYKCTKCDYQARQRGNLERHMFIHTADKDVARFSCYHCDYRTHRKCSLQIHVLLHNKQNYEAAKILKCYECDFKTAYKSSLERHIMRHKSGKKFLWKKPRMR